MTVEEAINRLIEAGCRETTFPTRGASFVSVARLTKAQQERMCQAVRAAALLERSGKLVADIDRMGRVTGWHVSQNMTRATEGLVTLPREHMAEVLSVPPEEARDLFVAGSIESDTLTLIRGDLTRLTVPLSIFRPGPAATPDFRRFRLDDYGHSVCFGEYSAAAEFVLNEIDPEWRRRKGIAE